MDKDEFNATEVIAGFPLTRIKRALAWVGIMDDRDDIKNVADALGCQRPQAERVLEALERRGLVTKSAKKRQWDTTPLGARLRFLWKPPRRIEPVIERDEETDAINQGFESVPCSIYRAQGDDEIAFEEADLQIGVFVEYESPRVIEISVSQPDDYDHRDESGTIESSVYVGIEEAKRIAAALHSAIEQAEIEIARRATTKPRRRKRPAPTVADATEKEAERKRASEVAKRKAEAGETRAARAAEKGARKKQRAAVAEQRKKREEALGKTLAELKPPK